jgi:glucose/mannose-6-phosphate isomerase
MLRATASAGAQVRESAALAAEADLSMLADEGRPRAVVVAGIGTAGLTGNILATVAGRAARCRSSGTAAPASPAGSAPPTW